MKMKQIIKALTALMMTASFAVLAQDGAPTGSAPTGTAPSAPAPEKKAAPKGKKTHHKKADKKESSDSSKQ
jgi:hypothetical protein